MNITKALVPHLSNILQIYMSEFASCMTKEKIDYLSDKDNLKNVIHFSENVNGAIHKNNKIIFGSNTHDLVVNLIMSSSNYDADPKAILVPPENFVDNDKDYLDYLRHFVLTGKTEYDFYLDVLPHEAMHLIGVHGGLIGEGVTERRTREICKKYNIRCAPVLHSKETKIVGLLDKLVGKDTLNKVGFGDFIADEDKFRNLVKQKYGNRLACELISAENLYESTYLTHYNTIIDKFNAYRKMDFSFVTSYLEKLVKIQEDRER